MSAITLKVKDLPVPGGPCIQKKVIHKPYTILSEHRINLMLEF
jgi:hypothetical protein